MELSLQNLHDSISHIKSQAEEKISLCQDEFHKRYGNLEDAKQSILGKIKEVQSERDVIISTIDSLSDVKLVKDKDIFVTLLTDLNSKILDIPEVRPMDFEMVDLEHKFLPYESYKFVIPQNRLKSSEHRMYDMNFSVSINDDLIGLFKSFDVIMEPSEHGAMEMEYDVFFISNNGRFEA